MKGKGIEKAMRRVARHLADHQVARIYRWPEEKVLKAVPIRCEGCGTVRKGVELLHTERPGSDFFGFTATGRAILIECKELRRASLPIWSTSGLKAHQMLSLRELHRADGLALLVWKRDTSVATVDYGMIEQLSQDRRSLPWKDIPEAFIHKQNDADLLSPYLLTPATCAAP